MMRTTSFGLFMLFVLAAHAHSQGANVTTRPNIVVVVADDMGWRDTGYSGNPIAKTPALDEMASRGVRFDYFYAAQQMKFGSRKGQHNEDRSRRGGTERQRAR